MPQEITQSAQIIGPVIAAIIAVIGWGIVHWLSARRDIANKRKDKITHYLIEAYRKLEKGSNPKCAEDTWGDIESAIADIQLLGTAEQANLARQFIQQITTQSRNGTSMASTTDLLNELRRSLRNELKLPTIGGSILHLRFESVPAEQQRDRLAKRNALQSVATPTNPR